MERSNENSQNMHKNDGLIYKHLDRYVPAIRLNVDGRYSWISPDPKFLHLEYADLGSLKRNTSSFASRGGAARSLKNLRKAGLVYLGGRPSLEQIIVNLKYRYNNRNKDEQLLAGRSFEFTWNR